MRLALIIGKQQGTQITQRLRGIKDNLDIDSFDSISEFIDTALKRNTIYDRVLVLSKKLTTTTLKDLHSYWGSTSKETNVVVLGKVGEDKGRAVEFLEMFKTPVAAVMLVNNTTVSIIAEAVLRPTAELTATYGIKDFLSVELDEDIAPAPVPQQEAQPAQAQPVQPQAQPVQSQASSPAPQQPQQPAAPQPKKRSFFSALFGGKKKEPVNENIQQVEDFQPYEEQYLGMEDMQIDGQEYDAYGNPIVEVDENGNPVDSSMQGNIANQAVPVQGSFINETPMQSNPINQEPQMQGSFSDEDIPMTQGTPAPAPNIESNFSQFQDTPLTPDNSMQATTDNSQYSDQPYIVENDTDTASNYETQGDFNPQMHTQVDTEPMSVPENHELNNQFLSSHDAFDSQPVSESLPIVGNDLTQEVDSAEADFSNISFGEENWSESVLDSSAIVGVDDNFGDMGVGSEDESYRQVTEQPKVVTQTVVKEVIRNTGGSSKGILQSIYKGKSKKILVVTGDRGTGITSTALNIATTLAKKIDVLYFDCDIENHGLLSYVDYGNFKSFGDNATNGLKRCRTSQAFDQCIVSWDSNLYILSSDYSCDVDDDELAIVSEVVAERSTDFGVVVVDCPADKLSLITDLILIGNGIICVDGTKRGFMNMLCQFEKSTLPTRFKRTLISRGSMFVTKCSKQTNLNKLVNFIKAIYEPSEVDWLSPQIIPFNGKLSDKLLNMIFEG